MVNGTSDSSSTKAVRLVRCVPIAILATTPNALPATLDIVPSYLDCEAFTRRDRRRIVSFNLATIGQEAGLAACLRHLRASSAASTAMSDGPTSKTAVSRQVPHARPAESLVAGEPAALKAALQSPPVSARPARDGATDDWHTCLARSVVSRPDGPQRRSNNHRVAWKTLTQHPTDRIHADDQQPDRPLYGQPRCRNGYMGARRRHHIGYRDQSRRAPLHPRPRGRRCPTSIQRRPGLCSKARTGPLGGRGRARGTSAEENAGGLDTT